MRKERFLIRLTIMASLMLFNSSLFAQQEKDRMDIMRIWDRGGHNAYTDINFYKNKLFVAFREANTDIPQNDSDNGKIRILNSVDGEFWESAAVIELEGVDLRNPKISVTPKKRMMILMTGTKYEQGELASTTSYISLADASGTRFSDPEPIELGEEIKSEFDCLWQVTWYNKMGYGVLLQNNVDGEKGMSKAYLVKAQKKSEFEVITELNIEGNPVEATVEFLSGSEMTIIAQREGKPGILGTSKAPYTDWTWKDLEMEIFCTNHEIIPINKILLGTTIQGENGLYSALFLGKKNEAFREVMKLPSGGETGSIGMFSIAGYVWLSYHSSHEGKTSVYYARIPYSKFQ